MSKMSKKIQINAIIESSDHDGWCSDNECEYIETAKVFTYDVPVEYKDFPIGEIKIFNYKDIIDILPEPCYERKFSCYQSWYCDNSEESIAKGLKTHESRYRIISVHIIN
jgi:hypothetical protein